MILLKTTVLHRPEVGFGGSVHCRENFFVHTVCGEMKFLIIKHSVWKQEFDYSSVSVGLFARLINIVLSDKPSEK